MKEPSALKAVLPLVVFRTLPSMSGGGRGVEWGVSPPGERSLEELRGLEETRGLEEGEVRGLDVGEIRGLDVGEMRGLDVGEMREWWRGEMREDFLTGVEVWK